MDHLLEIADGFWNIRGQFKVGGLLDVGTQASLVQRERGDFILLDAYSLSGQLASQVFALTEGGRAVSAILHLHPFHTVHVSTCAAQFPKAQLFGTARHKARTPNLSWQTAETDSPALHELFAEDLTFSVPRGVDFIPENEHLHFASVLALHRKTKALHVDDTLTWMDLPLVGGLRFHPTLPFVLQKRPRAVADFRAWAEELIQLCADAEFLCTAHGKKAPPRPLVSPGISARIRKALRRTEGTLRRHERRYG